MIARPVVMKNIGLTIHPGYFNYFTNIDKK